MENENVEVVAKVDNKKKSPLVIVLPILALVVAGYFFFAGSKMSDADIAMVNGVAIPKTAYEAQLNSAITLYQGQGMDTTKEEVVSQIRKEVLDNLINNELLAQGVVSAGIKSNPEDVEKQFQLILTQTGGAEALNAELVKNNITEAQLRENISKQITFDSYLLQNVDINSINVTDEEVQQFYVNYTKAQEGNSQAEIPPLTEISAQIKQQLVTNQQQILVKNFIDSLRAKAKIQTATI